MATAPTPAGDERHASLGRADLAMQLALRSVMSGVLGRSHEILLGRYRVRERLGHGGCGLVLLAEDPELDREVAIKVVLPTRAEHARAKWQEALQREARALARLRHPNVVEVFDAGTTDYFDEDTGETQLGVYLVMERLRGRTLRQWLAKKPRTWREIVDVHLQAARGLMAAHGVGIVHRDFKPDNVLLTDDGRVVLIDFGLADEAREIEEPSSIDVSDSQHGDLAVTRKSRIVGTPLYMAPEQHLGRDVGPAADQYAWCVSLYQALYGRQPFSGDSMDEIVAQKFHGKLPRATIGPPRALYRVLARGLKVEPRSRHADLEALVRATQRAAAGPRRYVPALAAGATLAGAATIAALTIARPQHPCDDAPLSWKASWSDEQREQVGAGLGALADANASAIATRVLDQVDRHGRRWQSAYDQVCGREGAGEHVVAQLECLERGLDQVEHVGAALSALTDENLGQASPLIDGLRPPSECLVAAHADDRSEAERAELAELWRRMDEVNVQVDATGQLSDPEWAKAALERADQLGDAALASTIAWRLGQVGRAAGRLEEGADYMHTAVFRAAAAHDHQRALRLMPLLILAVGSDLRRRDEAESLFAHAKLMGAQLDDAREQIADSETSLAYIAIEAGEKDRAVEIYERALAVYESLPEMPRELPRVRLALAGNAAERGDYDRASAMLARARTDLDQLSLPTDLNYATIDYLEAGIAEKRGDHEAAIRGYGSAVAQLRVRLHGHPFVGVGLCGLAAAQMDAGQLDEANASIEEAVSLATTAYGAAHADTIRYELTLAEIAWRRDRFADSIAAVERAMEGLAQMPEREVEFLADAYMTGAWSAWAVGDLAKMERWIAAMHGAKEGENTSNVDFPRALRRLDAALALARNDAAGARAALARPIITSVIEPAYDPELERRLDAVMLALADGTARPDATGLALKRTTYFDAFVRGTEAAVRTRDKAVLPAATASPR
jgi:serine/threonine protein kinase/tetratricopeptide (TPR) repeat protein